MSVKKNIIRNGIATGIQKLIKVCEQLLLVPFFITAWGTGYYGEWLTLTIIPSMLAFSDLGFGSAAANTFVLRYASGDFKGAANVAKSGTFIISMTVAGSMFIGAILVFILDYYGVFNKSLIPKHDAIWAVSLLMLARILNFYQQLFEAYYRSARRAALSTNLVSGYSSVNLGVSLLVLLFHGGIIAFSMANLLVSIAFNLFYAVRAKVVLPFEKEVKGSRNKSDLKSISGKGFGYLLSPIWQSIYFQGTTFVVRITLGPEAVAVFNTVRTVSRSANQAYSMVNGTVFPELQYEVGAGNMEKAKKLFRTALGFVLIIALSGMLVLAVGGPWLYEKWTHKMLHPPALMWNIFLIGIAFNAMWWTAGVMFRAMNKPYGLAIMGVVSASISVVLSYFLSKGYGLTGAAIGSLALDIIMAFYVLPVSCRFLGQSLTKLPGEIVADFISLTKGLGKGKFSLSKK